MRDRCKRIILSRDMELKLIVMVISITEIGVIIYELEKEHIQCLMIATPISVNGIIIQ